MKPMKFVRRYYLKEADGIAVWLPRDYYDDIVSEIGLEGSRAVNTPVTTEARLSSPEEKAPWDDEVDMKEGFLYRRLVGNIRFAVACNPTCSTLLRSFRWIFHDRRLRR